MNNMPKKRTNPFAKPITPEKEEKIEEVVQKPVEEPVKQPVEPVVIEEEPEIEEYVEPIQPVRQPVQRQAPKQAPRTQRQSQKNYYVPEDPADRQKYTSTMDVKLRRRIKIVCATRGIMFSEFIEIACREKLDREGDR